MDRSGLELPSVDLHDLTTGVGGGKLPIVDPSAVWGEASLGGT
jgi:hypothetical protein